ncbi:hypothetical protein GCM10023317_83600 [Actinopolymorpha pittospori]|uniref:Uncharacterized protein n=1 Tax=Actinopolymorpha pittospori TaxID=648752 RepID=A0A927N3T3_9ACTN|nr:hypothetical protein [Actinopolymorpha pittospori]
MRDRGRMLCSGEKPDRRDSVRLRDGPEPMLWLGAISPRFREAFLSLSTDSVASLLWLFALFVHKGRRWRTRTRRETHIRAHVHDSTREDPAIRRHSTGWHAITTADITRGKDLT